MTLARRGRAIRKTLLAYGEGQTEKAFLKYLKSVYSWNQNIAVSVCCNSGKCPKTIINNAIKKIKTFLFDKTFILLDKDVEWPEASVNKAVKHEIDLIGCNPCIEGFFLSLLEPKLNLNSLKSDKCKKIFEQKYLNSSEKLEASNYAKIFPKTKLEKMRKKNKKLDRIIKLIANES